MSHSKKYDVIIIGAGIAGLRAAQYLANEGHEVLLLEARNRVGGRIHTIQTTSGYPIEAGSSMLLNPGTIENPNLLVPLLQGLKLKTSIIDISQMDLPLGGMNLSHFYEEANQKIQNAKKKRAQSLPSLAEVLEYDSNNLPKPGTPDFLARQTITALLTHHTGAPLDKISLAELMLVTQTENNPEFISGGYQYLPEDMARKSLATQRVTMIFNTRATEIHHNPKEAEVRVVTHHQKTYHAHTVICAVPLGVLKQKKLQFFPKLSTEKQQLIQYLQIGNQNKIILEFEKPFWEEEVPFLYPGSNDLQEWPEYTNLFHFSNGKTATLVCNVCAEAAQFNHLPEEKIVENALVPLKKMYANKLFQLKAAYVTHWDTDPNTLGSTSCCGTNHASIALNHFEIPESGGLYFAGAHTLSNTERETVQGAYLSGLRAALDINLALKSTKRYGIFS